MQNYLLTSPLESSWRLTNKNYILNHDALYDHNTQDEDKEFIFLDPYGININTKKNNEKYIDKLVAEIQKDLSSELNKFHNENYENRYWKVITGNWLKRAIKIIFYRYKCIDRAVNLNLNLFTTASNLGDYNFYTKDSISIHSACMNSEWNYNLVSNILRHSFVNKIDIQNYKTKNNFLSSLDVIEKEKKKNTFKKFFLYTYSKIQNLSYPLYKKNNYYIKDSCLPKLTELKLSLLLKQFPILFKDQIEIPEKYDDRIRNKINLEKKNIDEVEKVIRFFIPNLLPTTYLENYLFIKEKSKNLKWPNNPKAIITGNSYEFDELFKFWSADKLTKGTKYYIFQHGTLHASHVSIEQSNEYQVCDRYFNWGKKFNNKKNVKTFNFKLFNIKKTKLKKIKILVICKARGYENEAYDRSYEYKKIFAGVKTLIKLLPKKILENAHFRIKDIFKKNDERDFLNSNNLKILDSNSNIFQYMKSSDLVVHMYNSTGVLECLSLNIPTMFYWPDSKNYRNHYDDDFISFCKDKQIFCETAETLVENIIEKFHDIDEWWNQNELQSERRFICEQYSALPNKNSLKDLTKKIKHEK